MPAGGVIVAEAVALGPTGPVLDRLRKAIVTALPPLESCATRVFVGVGSASATLDEMKVIVLLGPDSTPPVSAVANAETLVPCANVGVNRHATPAPDGTTGDVTTAVPLL